MSIEAMTWAFKRKGLTPTEKIVLLALADWANDDGECYPGQTTIAEKCDVSERTVRSVLARLIEWGLIDSEERRRPDGYRTSNLYRLRTSPANPAAEASPAKSDDLTGKIAQPHRQLIAGQEPSVEPPVEPSDLSPAPPSELSTGATVAQVQFLCDLEVLFGGWRTHLPRPGYEGLSMDEASDMIREAVALLDSPELRDPPPTDHESYASMSPAARSLMGRWKVEART